MNKSLQKLMSNVIAVVMLVTSVFSGSVFTYAENNDVTLADAAEPTGTVWTIGDSTVCEYTSENVESYNYRQGWGMRLGDYFNSKTTVKNIAKSGRSVRDFRVYEGGKYYTDFKENLKAGDYVLIQFGHNDQKEPLVNKNGYAINGNYGKTDANGGISSAAGLTDWQTKADENGYITVDGVPDVAGTCTEGGKLPSFEAILWKDYVKYALEKGAYPVLVTPIVRASGEKDSAGKYPLLTKIDTTHVKVNWKVIGPLVSTENLTKMNYVQTMYDVAAYAKTLGYDVPVIDLYEDSCAYWTQYIAEHGDVNALHANDKGNVGQKDRTHLSREGASVAAGLVADEINKQNLPLAKFLKVNSTDDPTETTTDKTETTTDKTETTTEVVVDDRGDIDGSGNVDVNDASLLLTYVLDRTKYLGGYSDTMMKYLGDVNGDGNVTSEDVAQILEKALSGGNFEFSGKKPVRPSEETTTAGSTEATTEVTTDATETTTEATTEGTTEKIVEGEPQDAIYEGYDLVVDSRANTDATREGQPIFKTVREAISAAGTGGTEEKPVVIGVVPGVYREPVRVNAPYITLKKITNSSSEADDATLTWYWLTNYTYDNIGADGDVDMSMPNTEANGNPNIEKMPNWGRSTWIQKGATGFRAEGIYFENSANLYVTQEELDAHVRPITETQPERADLAVGYGTEMDKDVRTRKYRERGCALYTEADKVIFENCKVISTQDTIGTNGRALFKDCYLAGCVDFICGGGQILFDSCNIHWQSSPYSEDTGDRGGPLTAASTAPAPAKGYLFYNCRVTGEEYTEQCNLGRPWGGTNTETVWVNTVADISKSNNKAMISDAAWGSMGCEPEKARGYFEYNSKDANGNVLDTSKRKGTTNDKFTGGVLDAFNVVKYNPYQYTAFTYPNNEYDGWDPLNVVDKWNAINAETDKIILGESYSENFVLPDAPDGFEVKYDVDSNFAKIADDGKTVEVTRPLFGQPDADVTFTVYLKKAGTIDGVETTVSTKILARTDTAGTFTAKGNIKLTFAPATDLNVKLTFNMASGFEAAVKNVVVPAGETTVPYEVAALPAAEYNVVVTMDSDLFSVKGGEIKNFTGAVNVDTNLDIEIGTLETITKFAGDLAGDVSSGYTMEKVSDDILSDEVYHFKKEASASNDAKQKYVWDLAELVGNSEDLTTTDNVRIAFKVRVPDTTGWSNKLMNYFDIVGGDVKDYAGSADSTRYVRFRVGNNWQQMDAIRCDVGGWSGSSNNDTQKLNLVGKFDSSANTWRNVYVTIDFKNEQVKFEGDNGSFFFEGLPADIDRTKLNFVIYPQDTSGLANNEYYITKPVVSFERFVPEEDSSTAYAVSGTSSNITSIKLVNTEQSAYEHNAVIGEDGAISFAKNIPAAKYAIGYTLADGAKFKEITGTGVTLEDGIYYITVDKEITDFNVLAEKVAGFADAETAVKTAFDAAYQTSTGSNGETIYTVDTAITIPEADGYTIEIVEGSATAINANGTLNRPDYGVDAGTQELKFKITNNATSEFEEYPVNVKVESKTAEFFYRDFEESLAGSADEGVDSIDGTDFAGEIVNVAGRGNVVKFSNFKKDGTQADGGKLVVGNFEGMDDGIYVIGFDFMKDDVSNRGWRFQFGEYIDLLFDTTNINVSTSGSVSGCGGYTDEDVYGASKNVISDAKANEWHNIQLVTNNKNAHVDVYLDKNYVTSYKGVEGKLPNNLMFQSYWGANHKANIYVDNLFVEKLDKDFDAAFDEVVSDSAIPTEITDSDKTVYLPTLTNVDNTYIIWSCDKGSDVVELTNEDSQTKAVFKAQQSGTTATLKALIFNSEIKKPYPGCSNVGVVETISHTKTYTINFATNSTESFAVSGDVKFDFAAPQDTEISVTASQNGEVKGSATVSVAKGETSKAYTIENLVPGEYDIAATVVTEGTKNVVKNIVDSKESVITTVTGADKDDIKANVIVGETEVRTYKVDFDTVDTLPTALGSGDTLTATVAGEEGSKYLDLKSTASGEKIGVAYDLLSLVDANDLETVKAADKVTVSYKVKRVDGSSGDSHFDLTSALAPNMGQTYGYDGRFCNIQAMNGWSQFNLISQTKDNRVAQIGSGSNGSLKFGDNADAWYDINLTIDYANQTVLGTLGVGENIATFVLEGGSQNGTSGLYPGIDSSKFPTNITRDALNLAFYPRVACEYYLDDLAISFEAFKTEESTASYTVSGTVDSTVSEFSIATDGENVMTYPAVIDGTSFKIENVPAGTYVVNIDGFELTGTGVSGDKDNGYKLTVSDSDITDIVVSATTTMSLDSVVADRNNSVAVVDVEEEVAAEEAVAEEEVAAEEATAEEEVVTEEAADEEVVIEEAAEEEVVEEAADLEAVEA